MKSLCLVLIFIASLFSQTELKQGTGTGTGIYFSPNNAVQLGPEATQGGIILAQKYSGDDYLGTISSNYSSGSLVLGYGAAGKYNLGAMV